MNFDLGVEQNFRQILKWPKYIYTRKTERSNSSTYTTHTQQQQ